MRTMLPDSLGVNVRGHDKPPQKPRFPPSPEEKGARGIRANA